MAIEHCVRHVGFSAELSLKYMHKIYMPTFPIHLGIYLRANVIDCNLQKNNTIKKSHLKLLVVFKYA